MTPTTAKTAKRKAKPPAPTFPEPGVYFDVPEDVYHANKALMSQSALKQIQRCPAKYAEFVLNCKTVKPPTDEQLLGTATHFCILEPGLYDSKVIARQRPNMRTNAGKDEWAGYEQEADTQGKILITLEDEERICRMRDAVHAHPEASDLLANGRREMTIVWDDSETGVRCKQRMDSVPPKTDIILDLKTTRSSHPDVFKRDILKFGYHVQASFYWHGYQNKVATPDAYIIIAVEKSAPYPVTLFAITPELMLAGEAVWRDGMSRYIKCLATERWPGYTDEIVQADVPEWMTQEGTRDGSDDEDYGF